MASEGTIWQLWNLMERIVAGAVLTLMGPALLISAIAIIVMSRRSPFVAHQRVGQGGRLIWVLKLRTMWDGHSQGRFKLVHRLSQSEAPLLPPAQKNARVTSRFAAFCRRFSVDELPQLWQVIQGEMSLIGPRPLTRQELTAYYGGAAASVMSSRPGISGLWQVSGRSRLTYPQRRRLDVFLVRKRSFPLYFKILWLTIPRVLSGKDAW